MKGVYAACAAVLAALAVGIGVGISIDVHASLDWAAIATVARRTTAPSQRGSRLPMGHWCKRQGSFVPSASLVLSGAAYHTAVAG